MSNHRDGCLSSQAVSASLRLTDITCSWWSVLISDSSLWLPALETGSYYWSPHASLKPTQWRGGRGDISCLSMFMWNPPCDAVMWWTAPVHPKIPLAKCSTWQQNCTDLVPSLIYYNIIEILVPQWISGSWLLMGIIHLFLWGQMKAEVITLVPGKTPEEK